MTKIVLATGNQGKVRELARVLADCDIDVVPQSDFNVDDAEETGTTFVENAIIKARHAAKMTGLPAIADDSGLEVDYLHGAPGIYSSRFAGNNASDEDNVNKLLAKMANVGEGDRSARFRCVLVYMRHADDPTPLICMGTWQGTITEKPSGSDGFGYDPIFFVPDQGCTAAELSPAVKNSISHRGQALAKLVKAINSR